jgi:hypothetical protein
MKDTETETNTDDGVVREPENSTVDDWIGQRVQRDEERAERLLEETGDPDEAARQFDETAEKHRPEDLPTEQRRTS